MWQQIFKNPRCLFSVKTHRIPKKSCGMLSDVRCAPRISGHTIDVASSKGNSESLKGFSCIAMCYDIMLPMNIQFGTIASWDKSVLCAHESWFLGCLWCLHVKGCVVHISTCFPQLHQPNLPASYELGQSDTPHRADLSSSVLQAHQEWALKTSEDVWLDY